MIQDMLEFYQERLFKDFDLVCKNCSASLEKGDIKLHIPRNLNTFGFKITGSCPLCWNSVEVLWVNPHRNRPMSFLGVEIKDHFEMLFAEIHNSLKEA